MYTRHIDIKNNLVFINSLESVSMDLSRFPQDTTFYIEIGDYWHVEWFDEDVYLLSEPGSGKDWNVREIALEIFEEAILIWEEERKMKFTKDMHKDYEDKLIADWNKQIEKIFEE